jgi:hypothetical protein
MYFWSLQEFLEFFRNFKKISRVSRYQEFPINSEIFQAIQEFLDFSGVCWKYHKFSVVK